MSGLTWWVWGIAAMGLALLEMLAPAYVFLGFAIGAGLVSLGLLLELGIMPGNVPGLLILFGVLSGLAWIGLRLGMGVRKGQIRTFRHDINED
ncbi:MAG: hypothetical protein AAFU80_14030 [Pseudomonadota bacterium]